MGKKEEYKLKNEQFLQNLRTEEGVKELAAGVLYRILESGQAVALLLARTVLCRCITRERSSTAGSLTIPGSATVRKLSG